PLPPDIREKVKTFLRLVTRPSMVEMDMAIKTLQTAQKRLDELKDLDYMDRETLFQRTTAASAAVSEAKSLVATAQLHYNQSVSACVVTQPDAFQLALDIQDAVGSSCAPVGQSVQCVHSPGKTGPSIHIVNGQRRIPQTPNAIVLNVQEYVQSVKRSCPSLMSSRAKLGENSLPQHDKQRRIVFREQGMASFFQSEIVSKIRHVISSRRPNVLFEAIEGYPTSHADLFLKVSTPNSVGKLVSCLISVELKRPYGDDYVPAAPETRSQWPNWVNDAEIPNAAFAEHAIYQLLHYMEDKDTLAPPSVRGSIVRNIGILSTFNATWIVIAAAADHSFETNASFLTELPVAIANVGNEQPRSHLYISQPFYADKKRLPIALAYTYVIEHIIDCMTNSTGGYKEVFLE
ncbi:hypothetical protein GGF41_003549, partial [Coemansia sp. RSA 2531]